MIVDGGESRGKTSCLAESSGKRVDKKRAAAQPLAKGRGDGCDYFCFGLGDF